MTAQDKEKDNYHHGDLRQAILEAACQHLREENTDSLSLRALARKIGVSQTAPYRHFDSRNALFAGIAVWGFEILEQELRQALSESVGSASDKMMAIGLAYLRFSQEHFEKYRMLYASNLVDFEEYEALQVAGDHSFDILLDTIRVGRAQGDFIDKPVDELAAIIWSGLHGMASLLQVHYKPERMNDRSAAPAVRYLTERQRDALQALLASIRVKAD